MKKPSEGASSGPRVIDDPAKCAQCGATTRLDDGLCVNCFLRAGLEAEGEESHQAFESMLAEADVPDKEWRLGHYEILEEIGRGGMGVIYRARQQHSRRIVAVKRILAYQVESRETLARFRREAEAAASLDHPNILPIYEVSESEDGLPFFSMKYATGGSLRAAAPALQSQPNDCVRLMAKVVRAIHYAHAHGILHRDLQPGNILLDDKGEPMVSDFGLAKWLDGNSDLTRTLTTFGTPGYIAPEQAECAATEVAPAADIYSLGAILFHLLAGRPPFVGANALFVVHQAAVTPAPRLRSLAPSLDRDLETIVARSLEREPQARYQSAGALAEDLERWLERRPIRARRVLPPARIWRWSRRNPILAGAAATCLVLAVAVVGLLRGQFSPPPKMPEKSIAVLPFENLSKDEGDAYFADELTESLINSLSRVRQLRVIAPGAVFNYKARPTDPRAVGRELHVEAVVTGSVVRSGERVRVAARLIHAATNRNLWTDSYERDLRDVLALQRDVARDIVGEIRIKLTPQEQAQFGDARPVNPAAYDQYLRGRFYLNRQNKDDNETAIAALERAVATDPTFAAAYAELAQAYVWKLFLFAPKEGQWAEKAFVAAEKALSLDPNLAVAYLARGRLLWTPANHFPHEKAIREYHRALVLNPNLDEARNQLALVYCHIGAFDEALQESNKAVTTNPNNNLAQFRIGQTLNFQGKYEQALSVLRGLPQEVNPALVGHQIAWALFNLGRKEEASALLDQLLRDHPEDSGGVFASVQAVLAASAGQQQIAEGKIRSAVERGKGFGHFHHTAYHIACAYALMEKPKEAIKWLEAAAEDGFPCYPLFERDTNLDNLRPDARFVTFLAQLRRQWEYYRTIL